VCAQVICGGLGHVLSVLWYFGKSAFVVTVFFKQLPNDWILIKLCRTKATAAVYLVVDVCLDYFLLICVIVPGTVC